ncbi:glycoside hydrolase family 3 protein [Flavobacteriaceae bacterium F89]|uniref:beta-N-acetylhexosaminidase n=1 Tax=Cerina litoralis TaxID=2874477 RepID=A0AAE3EVL4_9FLAO|nr:glycoside hydrolase family 3 N-terminal domain-containing protein [Cerina litoralis]MCG2460462.1 glycoside hydrolase family 3 protein [Cerina litoralis]
MINIYNPLAFLEAKNTLSLREKVGQFFMPAAFINDSEDEIQELEHLIKISGIGGLCFFHSRASAATNFEGKKKIVYNAEGLETLKKLIQRYQKAAKHPLLISIDAEWGLAMRIENTPQYPYAITLGASGDTSDLLVEVGRNIARDCREAGIHWNLAPVVDINNNPNNPVIGYRSFGEDKRNVAEKATALAKGMQAEGILTSIKHFPGHGDTATDSHLGLPVIGKSKEELYENELYPFIELIKNGADSVMVGHLSVPALTQGKTGSSSISKEIITGVLRKELGFDGVVISDALNMHSVSKLYPAKGELEWLAFDAGNDILCFAEHVKEGIETILRNTPQRRIESSFKRVWHLKEKVFSTLSKNTRPYMDESELNKKLAYECLTLFQDNSPKLDTTSEVDYHAISLGKKQDNAFFNRIAEEVGFTTISDDKDCIFKIKSNFKSAENILLALFPPKVKPQNNFDFSDAQLQWIQELIDTKNVVLYLFGNPFVLNMLNLKKAKTVVVAYQSFETFQMVAAEHFLGKFEAKGKLPVTIAR